MLETLTHSCIDTPPSPSLTSSKPPRKQASVFHEGLIWLKITGILLRLSAPPLCNYQKVHYAAGSQVLLSVARGGGGTEVPPCMVTLYRLLHEPFLSGGGGNTVDVFLSLPVMKE